MEKVLIEEVIKRINFPNSLQLVKLAVQEVILSKKVSVSVNQLTIFGGMKNENKYM